MKNPEWSPGTWTYDPEEGLVVSDQQSRHSIVASCDEPEGYLLAAAKELYAALEQARTVILLLVRSLAKDETLGDHTGILDYAEQVDLVATAALAKARGESQ